MNGKKILAIVVVLVMALGVFAGCSSGGSGDGETGDTPSKTEDSVSVGLVTDVGGVNDQSFNQSAWEGLQRFGTESGADVKYIESKDESSYAPNIETFIDEKRNLIWGVGFMLGDSIAKAGEDNPNTQFAIIDYAYADDAVPNQNITGVVFSAQECSFLVGYIAGKMTKSKVVGHINGISSPTMESFAVGYYAGVLTANKDVKILGQYSGSFSDPAAGKNIAKQYISEKADIIYSAAGATGNGSIEAAKEGKIWAIGVDQDQNSIAPDTVLTSALKNVGVAVYDVCTKFKNGDLKGGETLLYDLKNDGVGYATTGDHIPADIIAEVDDIKAKIISGEVKVPATAKEIEAMFPGKYNLPAAE